MTPVAVLTDSPEIRRSEPNMEQRIKAERERAELAQRARDERRRIEKLVETHREQELRLLTHIYFVTTSWIRMEGADKIHVEDFGWGHTE